MAEKNVIFHETTLSIIRKIGFDGLIEKLTEIESQIARTDYDSIVIEKIIQTTCKEFRLAKLDLLKSKRHFNGKRIQVSMIICYLLKKYLNLSAPHISDCLSKNINEKSVYAYCKKVEELNSKTKPDKDTLEKMMVVMDEIDNFIKNLNIESN